MLKFFVCLVNKRTLCSTKLKKNICKTASLKNKYSERNLRNQHIFYAARKACRMSDTGTSPFISFFFQPPYLHKMVCFLNSWKQLVKTIHLGEIIGLIHEKRYQNKTHLRYNFGSVRFNRKSLGLLGQGENSTSI